MTRSITIIIGGDTVPTKSNEIFLSNGQEDSIFNNVKNAFSSADLTIVNLECPLTNKNKYIRKAGPCLKAKPESINGLKNAGIEIYSLANNHIMDFGINGLNDTIEQIRNKQAF